MQNDAISYLRFSSPKQRKGDSYNRQIKATEDYCRKNNLNLIHKIEDKGVSGWTEENLDETASLGKLLNLIELGKIKKGTTLIIENLDRLTRTHLTKALRLFLGILENGIDIATTMDSRRYTMKADSTDLIIAITYLIRGNDESETKSKRVKEAWVKKRHLIESGVPVKMTQHPNWLIFENNKYIEKTEAVAVVKRVYEMYVNGKGNHVIAKTLNKEGVKAFSRTGEKFTFSSIERLLKNPAVIGRCEVVSPPKEKYYPAIISEEIWYKAQAIRKTNNHYKGTRNDSNQINILGGIIKCKNCNCNLVRYSCKGKNKEKYNYLTCSKAKYGEHKMVLFPYKTIENLFVIGLQHNGFLNNFIKQFSTPEACDKTSELQGKIIEKQHQIERIADAIVKSDSEALVIRLTQLEIDIKSLKEQLNLEKERLAVSDSKKESFDLLSSLISKNINDNDFRLQLRNFLRTSIKHILATKEDGRDLHLEIVFENIPNSMHIHMEKFGLNMYNYYIGSEQMMLFAVDQPIETTLDSLMEQTHKNSFRKPF